MKPVALSADAVADDPTMWKRRLVSVCSLEWRRSLGRGGVSMAVELLAAGSDAKMKVTVGVLQLRIDMLPPPAQGQAVPLGEINQALQADAVALADGHRQFYQYAKVWWNDFVEIHPSFRHRLVKVFCENESGDHRAASSYLFPLRAGRWIDTPRHAATVCDMLQPPAMYAYAPPPPPSPPSSCNLSFCYNPIQFCQFNTL